MSSDSSHKVYFLQMRSFYGFFSANQFAKYALLLLNRHRAANHRSIAHSEVLTYVVCERPSSIL